MLNNSSLYTQKDLVDMLSIPQQTLSRHLPEDGSFLINSGTGHKVKAYPLNVLPEDMRRQIVAIEMAAQPETSLEVAAKMMPEAQVPLKAWQREIRDARLMVLDCIKHMAPALGGITKATKEFAERSQNGFHKTEIAALVQKATAKERSQGVGFSTLRSWQSLLKKQGPDALAPVGGMPPAWPPWLKTFLQMYQGQGCPSIKLVYERLTAQGEQLPDLRTVQNWVKRLGKIEANKGRLGMLEAKKYRVHSLRKTDNLLPTDVYSADGYSGKFYVQNPYNGKLLKPELVTIIDVATRVVVGFAAGLAENRLNTLAALTDAISKAGVPVIFYTDNGPGFKNKMLNDPITGLMCKIGISDYQSIPGRAWSRGLIERAQASIWGKYSRLLPAYSDKNSDRHRQRELMKRIEKDLAEHGTSKDLMTWTQFLNWAQEVIDIYNNTPHSALPKVFDSRLNKTRHRTPAEHFKALAPKTEFYKPDAAMLENIMRPRVLRTADRGWIRFENQRYFNRDLEAYHGQQIIAEYDPADINRLWIRNADEQLICVAERDKNTRDYFPQTMMEIDAVKREDRSIKNLELKITDKQAETRGQMVYEISPEKEAQVIEFQQKIFAAEPALNIPDSVVERYELYCELIARTDELTTQERRFVENYPLSDDFIHGQRAAAEVEKWAANFK